MQIGDVVTYFDEYGKPHKALITANWGHENDPQGAINVVYVTSDEAKTDSYGRQILRQTSVVHKKNQSAPGRYYIEVAIRPRS